MNEAVRRIAADEAIFLPFFLMEYIPEGEARIHLFLWDRMTYVDWMDGGEEIVKEVLRQMAPQVQVAYMLVRNIGGGEYEYESGTVSADEGMVPHVLARVYLSYVKGEEATWKPIVS